MVGKYKVTVSSKKLRYEFEVKRNITILSGDSGTGKTTLIKMILLSKRRDSPYKVECDKSCVAFTVDSFRDPEDLAKCRDAIVFIDEDIDFIKTKEFARIVKTSDCYFVIATREPLKMLPYSCKEIFKVTSKSMISGEQSIEDNFHELFTFSTKPKLDLDGILSCIIVEDSNSGYSLFNAIAERKGIDCISAGGNSNVVDVYTKRVLERKDTGILVVVDGAAFGAYYTELHEAVKRFFNTVIFLPESFEYLLLLSELFFSSDIKDKLLSAYNYAESSKYFSWEQYYTSLLCELTVGTDLEYSKSKLNHEYLINTNLQKIMNVFKEGLGLK